MDRSTFKKIYSIYFLLALLISIGYMIFLGMFGTGYESNGFQHFKHALRGVSIELSSATNRVPTQDDLDKSSVVSRSLLKEDALVASPFGDDDKTFYLFVKRTGGASWQAIVNPISDFRGFVPLPGSPKIWLTKLSYQPEHSFYLVGAINTIKANKLKHGDSYNTLPPSLRYTHPVLIE